MDILYYTWEVLCQAWPIILLMGMIAIPILWIWFEEDNEFENLDEYYNMKKEYDKNKDKCDN
mgnify:FL=1